MKVCQSADLPAGSRLVIDLCPDRTIGLFRLASGTLHAYENICPHQGGPVCQGTLLPRVVENLNADKAATGFRFDESDMHIVCPWHGFEFSISTGQHAAASHIRLQPVSVAESNGEIHVVD